MGQRPLFILRCARGATARDAEYNGGALWLILAMSQPSNVAVNLR